MKMEYTIVQSFEKDEAVKAINEHLQDDWKLHGNLCMALAAREGGGFIIAYAQAMTRITGGFFAQDVAEPE
jgi:hypothetical protein